MERDYFKRYEDITPKPTKPTLIKYGSIRFYASSVVFNPQVKLYVKRASGSQRLKVRIIYFRLDRQEKIIINVSYPISYIEWNDLKVKSNCVSRRFQRPDYNHSVHMICFKFPLVQNVSVCHMT